MAKSKAKPAKSAKVAGKAKTSKPAAKAMAAKSKKPMKAVKVVAKAAKVVAKAVKAVAAKVPAAKAVVKAAPKFEAVKSAKGLGMKRFSPLDDRIVIEHVAREEKTAGGLYIPDSAQEKPTTGRVVAVGRGHRDAKGRIRPCDVKVGDHVLFTAWSGAEIELDGVKYVVMREPDLLGVTTV